jgi:hypothetical protein
MLRAETPAGVRAREYQYVSYCYMCVLILLHTHELVSISMLILICTSGTHMCPHILLYVVLVV